jgi:hypothetical protein
MKRIAVALVGAVMVLGSAVGVTVAAGTYPDGTCPDGYTQIPTPANHRAQQADRDKDGQICARTSTATKGPAYRDYVSI